MYTNRSQAQRSKSGQRKSFQKEQINLLLYKNSQLQSNKSKDSPLSKAITINRSKAKSSQGNYKDQFKKHSIDIVVPEKKISLSNWIQNGIKFDYQIKKKQKISKSNFNYHHVIGRGGFGKVWKVQQKKTGRIFAMKQMSKAVYNNNNQKECTFSHKLKDSINTIEKHVSKFFKKGFQQTCFARFKIDKHYIQQWIQCLEETQDIIFVEKKKFNQEQTRFFVACIFSGLQYLHSKSIIHRDIKPQNLVLDSKGYIRITDLGIAKQYRIQNNTDTSGTPGYMAPQVMCRQNHSYPVDYYALGVIAYQLMIGKRPYSGRSRKQIRDQILSKQTIIKKNQIPQGWSIQAADFVNKLIQRKPMLRLGWGGAQQIKKHPWLKNFPWQKLQKKQIVSPFIPDQKQDNFDGRHHATIQDEQMIAMIKENTMLLRKSSVQQLFQGYTYQDETKISELCTTSSQFNKKK